MLRYLLFSTAASMLLLGCQARNPYQAEGLPLPAAPIAAASHFDTSGYPVANNKKTYTYWCWQDQFLDSSNTNYAQGTERQILAEQLEQYALRPALSAEQCELRVKLESQHSQRIRHDYYDYPSARYGYGSSHSYHNRDRYSGIGAEFPIMQRSYIEYFQQLTLIFTDAQTGRPVWNAQSNVDSDEQAQTTEQALRKALNRMLKDYN